MGISETRMEIGNVSGFWGGKNAVDALARRFADRQRRCRKGPWRDLVVWGGRKLRGGLSFERDLCGELNGARRDGTKGSNRVLEKLLKCEGANPLSRRDI